MGYTTDFDGTFKLDKPLTDEHAAYLRAFSETRHMKRDAKLAAKLADPRREAVGLPIGSAGMYFVGNADVNFGQNRDASVLDHNEPATGVPGLWCKWEPTEDNRGIVWSGAEKFYEYVPWIEFLIAHFLKPWGYVLNGYVEWRGEDFSDTGVIVIKNNAVATRSLPTNRKTKTHPPDVEKARAALEQAIQTYAHGDLEEAKPYDLHGACADAIDALIAAVQAEAK